MLFLPVSSSVIGPDTFETENPTPPGDSKKMMFARLFHPKSYPVS